MTSSVTLDLLLSQSTGITLYYVENICNVGLVKEAILRGLQICNLFDEVFFPFDEEKGKKKGSGCYIGGGINGNGYGGGVGVGSNKKHTPSSLFRGHSLCGREDGRGAGGDLFFPTMGRFCYLE